MDNEFIPLHTIEPRHILAAVPGDTLLKKLAWIEAQLKPPTCDCGGGCGCDADEAARVAVKALREVETALDVFFKTEDNGTSSFETARTAIGVIYGAVDGVE